MSKVRVPPGEQQVILVNQASGDVVRVLAGQQTRGPTGPTGATGATGAAGADGVDATPNTQFTVTFDGGGSALVVGSEWFAMVNFAGTITGAVLLADTAGALVIDIQKDVLGSYPPTGADSIVASAPPTLAAASSSSDSTLTGWTTTFSAGDIFRFEVESCTTIAKATLILKVTKT